MLRGLVDKPQKVENLVQTFSAKPFFICIYVFEIYRYILHNEIENKIKPFSKIRYPIKCLPYVLCNNHTEFCSLMRSKQYQHEHVKTDRLAKFDALKGLTET